MSDILASSHPVPPTALAKPDFRNILNGDEIKGLFDYWDAKRGTRGLPLRSDIDPIDMPRPVLAHVMIVRVEADGGYRFRLAGTRMLDIFGKDITGKTLDEVLSGPDLENARRSYSLVIDRVQPWYSSMTYPVEDGRTYQYQRLTMPLGPEGAPDHLLSGLFVGRDRLLYENFNEVLRRDGLTRGERREYVLS